MVCKAFDSLAELPEDCDILERLTMTLLSRASSPEDIAYYAHFQSHVSEIFSVNLQGALNNQISETLAQ